MDHIRVALFISTRGTVPAVTVDSASPMTLSYRSPSGTEPWVSSSGRFRASLDQYSVVVSGIGQYAAANQLQMQLANLGHGAAIYEEPSGSGTQYAVAVGSYATRQQAESIRDTLSRHHLTGGALRLAGPLYWNAGYHPDAGSAEQAAAVLNRQGVRAFSVIHQDADGGTKHAVWIGGAADEAALSEAKTAAERSVPGIALSRANTGLPYMINRTDVTGGASNPVPHYALQAGDMKLRVVSDAPLQVPERYGRTYRGELEISQYSGALAVVNELPFEEYLYSVVGSELGASWPLEALKAQAVAARTFALQQGMRYGIAHVSDTTFDQAYKGMTAESPQATEAVRSTAGEVLVDGNGLIQALYSSNAGGMTADGSEVWGTELAYAAVTPSPDHLAAEGLLNWDHVVLPDGTSGYVRTDLTVDTGRTNEAGLALLGVNGEGINVRAAPYVDNTNNPAIAQVSEGDTLIRLGQTLESNAYNWMTATYSGEQLLASIKSRTGQMLAGPLTKLEVSARGPSGRATEVKANGQPITVSSPDAFRSVLLGIPSTRFDIESMAEFTILGADGKTSVRDGSGGTLHAVSGKNPGQAQPVTGTEFLAMGGEQNVRLLSQEPRFRFVGLGFGHGMGMSQWGARELAEYMNYDYKQILHYYYRDVELVKAQ